MKPTVSVVIPTFNRAAALKNALDSLIKQDYSSYEVIVIDDSSTDSTARLLKSYEKPVRVLRTKRNKGAAAARNLGLKHAKGEYIAFMDDDCAAHQSWLSDMVKGIAEYRKQHKVAGIAGTVHFPRDASVLMKAIYTMPQMDEGTARVLSAGHETSTNNLSCTNSIWKRSVLAELEGFDESLRRGQDSDLSYRALKRGYRFRLLPNAAVTHHYRSSLLGFLRQQYLGGIGGGIQFRRDRQFFGSRQYIIIAFPAFLAAGLFFPPLYLVPLGFCRAWLKAYRITHDFRVMIASLLLEYVKYYANLLGIWRGILSRT
jgi:glycosyltransferase involved in cell wall biosynthesis